MRCIWSVVAVVAAACCLMVAGTAAASSGAAAPFKAAYSQNGMGFVCSGAHVVQKDGRIKDSETCTLTARRHRRPSGRHVSVHLYGRERHLHRLRGTWAAFGFGTADLVLLSDFNGVCAKTWSETFSPNADGS